jgi:amino acid transporter
VSNAVGLLALINVASGAGKVFGYLLSLSGAATFIAWACIGIIHIRFRRAWKIQGHTVDELPFRAFLYPWGAYFISGLNIFLLFIQGYATFLTPFKPVDFVFSYIVIALFVILMVFWKVYKRTKVVNMAEVDLQYGRRTYLADADESEDKPSILTRAARSVRGRFHT